MQISHLGPTSGWRIRRARWLGVLRQPERSCADFLLNSPHDPIERLCVEAKISIPYLGELTFVTQVTF